MTAARRLVALLAGALALLALAAPAAAQDPGWVIESFDTDLEITPDGVVHVTETIAVDFRSLQRRGIFRDIPVRYTLSRDAERALVPEGADPADVLRAIEISDIEVSASAPDDVDLTRPTRFSPRDLRIRIGDPDVEVTGRQHYEIRYVVRGALNRFEDVDELSWNTTGHGWEAPIQRATATVTAPDIVQTACFRGPPGSTTPCEQGDGARFSASDLAPGEGLTVAVGLRRGSVTVDDPILVEQWTPDRAFFGNPAGIPLAVLVGLASLGGVVALAYRNGRDRTTRGGHTVDGQPDGSEPARRGLFSPRPTPVRYRPPEDLRPGQLGVIVDERADPVDVSATIVDLAVRGYLTISETRGGLFGRKRDWTLERTDRGWDDLLPFERALLSGLFQARRSVEVDELKGTFSSEYAKVTKALYADAVSRRWFTRSPETTRAVWLGVGVFALLAAVGLVVLAAVFTTMAIAAVPLVLAALALLFAHRWMPHRTPQGSRLLTEALGFREFIRTAEAGRMEFAEQENLFETYLPYAIVFGAVDKWAAAFAGVGAAATGVAAGWYVGSDGRSDFSSLSRGLSSFSSSVGSSLPTSPPSSSSGGSGGGGSSGGGFGGGGGGSW